MPPKTNEEWVEEFKKEWVHCWDDGTPSFAESSSPQGMLDHIRDILIQKDAEVGMAYFKGYKQGKFDAEMDKLNFTPPDTH